MFQSLYQLVEAACQKGPVKIAVAAGHDPDVMEALKRARELNLAEGMLVGNPEKMVPLAQSVGFELRKDQVIPEPDDTASARTAIALVREGTCSLLMKGKINTAALVRAVLDKEAGLRTGRLLSQVIVFQVPGMSRLMLMSDAAINIAPTVEQKAEICRNAIEVAHAIGIEKPNLAALCAFEFVNSEMPATLDAACLSMMCQRGQIKGAYIEGPIALDVPLSKFAADRKGVSSPLTENTDILIAPDIEAANIMYRAIIYFGQGESGGVVMGARVPLILLSRAETPETKLRSIAIATLVAAAQKK